MKNYKGFSLVEMLMVVAMFGLVLAGVYKLFNDFYKSSKIESKNVETEIEEVLTSNLLEVDIIHAGIGLADDLNNKPIEWDGSKLTIRSVFNATNNKTDGWILVDCDNGSWTLLASKGNVSAGNFVFLNIVEKKFVANGTFGVCPANEIMIGFPYYSGVASGCSTQFCNKITYSLSSTQPIKYCSRGTRNLLRKVGTSSSGTHIFDCVADFYVNFDYDSDNNSYISANERNVSIPSGDNATVIKKNLKGVNILLLLQEGKKDLDFRFRGTVVNGYFLFSDKDNNGACDAGDICFQLPDDYTHYRWKPVILKINPKGL
jgi:type IV pilus assembly protein PilW